MSEPHLIRYTYLGTTNGKPVGDVYVEDIDWLSPGSFSHTYDPKVATQWQSREAAELEIQRHKWPGAHAVPAKDAPEL